MNEMESAPNGAEMADELLDNEPTNDDNSIRELLTAQLESQDPPTEPDATPDEPPEDGAEAPTVEDDAPAPPQSWTEAERESWQDLPETARDAISRREKEFQAGLKSDAELQKVLAPLAEQLSGTGTHVDQSVQGLLQADRFIDENPLQAVQTLINKYGLADQVASQFNDAPTQTHSSDEIAQLRQEVNYEREVAAETRKWNSFTAEHPDAPQYAEVIASKIQANPSLTYEGAYEQAKELVTGLAKSNKATAEAARINGQTKAAAKANALNLPKGKTGNNAPVESNGSLRDDLTENARKLGFKL